MPRFFLHLHNDVMAIDEEGSEFPGPEEARQAAEQAARELAAEDVRRGKLNLANWIDVVDESGRKLFAVRYGDVIRVIAK